MRIASPSAALTTVMLVSLLAIPVRSGAPMSPKARKADKIIQKHVEALGGQRNIKGLKTLRIKGRLSQRGINMPFVLWMKRPGLARMDIDVLGQKIIQAYDGKTAWWVNPLFGAFKPREIPEEYAKPMIRWTDFEGPLVDYDKKRHRVEYVGKYKTNGGTNHKIKLTWADGEIWYVYVNSETYLEEKRTYELTFEGHTKLVANHLTDHKKVNDVVLFHVIKGEAPDGTRFTVKFDSIDANVEIRDGHFRMPQKH